MDPLEAEEMFNFADKDRDGKYRRFKCLYIAAIVHFIPFLRISWEEFQIMINPPAPPKPPTPHREMLARTLPNGSLMGNGVTKPKVEEKKVEEENK